LADLHGALLLDPAISIGQSFSGITPMPIACDFCVVATVTFQILYVLVVMEHASRRIIHSNVTAHPTAAWTLQQFREAIPSDHIYRFIIHDPTRSFPPG
jgi:putative transposase